MSDIAPDARKYIQAIASGGRSAPSLSTLVISNLLVHATSQFNILIQYLSRFHLPQVLAIYLSTDKLSEKLVNS
ncbi:hypothetical protein WKK05_17860 [Nostoc sp. UHCC 0302]|uniref:hypothetical protein n=1 Tax=Nostoc sp. UHCC 0302 TaxID=3134896 RepID=UPI00311CD640